MTEVYKTEGTIASAYGYAPFGAVTAAGIDQPIQWSSEFYDAELGMVYDNFRHYNPLNGRWISRDPIAERGGVNLYIFDFNLPTEAIDRRGNHAIEAVLPLAGTLAACDGPLPISDIGAATIVAEAAIYTATQPAPWSGDCSVATHAALQANVNSAKLSVGMMRKCKAVCYWVLKAKKCMACIGYR